MLLFIIAFSATKLMQLMALILLCELVHYLVIQRMQLEVTADKPRGGSSLNSLRQESL